jgi:PAS domain S-box-containing protein
MHSDERKNINSILDFAPEAGELGELIAAFDWSKTSLGPISTWPQSLRTCVHIMLSSRQPIWIGWGEELIKLYNDPYKSIVGGKHPWALGTPASIVWKDIWNDIEPMLQQVMQDGIGTYVESQLLIMERNGYPEETYYTFSYTAVPGDDGKIAGMFCANTDDTERIINERQLTTLTLLGKSLAECKTAEEVVDKTLGALQQNKYDFPFAVFRTLKNQRLELERTTPLGEAAAFVRDYYDLNNGADPMVASIKEAFSTRKIQIVNDPTGTAEKKPTGAWSKASDKTILLPIISSGIKEPFGLISIGLNPYRLFDERYESFFMLVADQIATSLADVNAFKEERKRAEALAEIDRAKTTFFSNISHELRTPLTLMLAPIEDALQDSQTAAQNKFRLDIANRNARRLLKLVNTLLDFSRIEAGRTNAKFGLVNLSTLTKDLASTFRAAIEKAGMELKVLADDGVEGYVDIDMWEKVMLNLLSNAFKYSHKGAITVLLKKEDEKIELTVSDRGIGIPAAELDKIFERFHRVQNFGGRSQEGTGIGLALVQELVKVHGGTISVESKMGEGSAFTVTIPAGKNHLPESQITGDTISRLRSLRHADIYIEEAMKWLPASEKADDEDTTGFPASVSSAPGAKKQKLLLADDNADMRAYLTRLLSDRYEVLSVNNGLAALQTAAEAKPDLVLSDVMMPEMDGFELVKRLKTGKQTRNIPVILLSARAGEEATIEGLATGADDYLTKPFSAKELLSRIDSNLKIAESRINSIKQLHNLFMSAPVAIAVLTGPEQCFEMANEKYMELGGKTAVVGKTIEEAFPELVDTGIKELLDNVYRSGEPYYGNEYEVDLVRAGRSEHLFLNFVYTPLRNVDGIITGVMVIAIDVTEMVTARRKIEQVVAERTRELTNVNMELQYSEKRYHRMIDEVEDYAIIFLDKNGIVQNWNKGAEKIKGYKESEIVGKSFEQFYLPEDQKNGVPKRFLEEAVANGKASMEGWRVKKGGNRFWGSILLTALHDDAGNVIGFSKVTRDLTERKLAEDKVREYSENLEAQNRELEQFAYAASHDMKEPLRKIYFFGTSLKDNIGDELDEKSANYLTRILASTQKMSNLVDNLLNYSKTTANIDAIEKVDLNQVVEEVIAGVHDDPENAGVIFEVDGLPRILGIPFQCIQLLDNLVRNSIKYRSPDRSCVIRISYEQVDQLAEDDNAQTEYHKISVIDNGIGFEQQYAERIFEIFQRLGTIPGKTGAGIGLAICKRIVLNHNGMIQAFGKRGEGARFDIYLPITI